MPPIPRSPLVAHPHLGRTWALALAVVALGNAGVFAQAGGPGSGRIVGTVTINDSLQPNPLAEMIVPPPSIVRGDPETMNVVVYLETAPKGHSATRPANLEQVAQEFVPAVLPVIQAGGETRLTISYPGPVTGTQP